jgi:SIR2-like domain
MSAAPRAIVHLRAQLERRRVGLIFGSGASKDLLFPDWNELVQRIAAHKDVKCEALLSKFKAVKLPGAAKRSRPVLEKSLSSITQVIYGAFHDRYIKKNSLNLPLTFIEDQKIRSARLNVLHDILYSDIDHDGTKQKGTIMNHPYLPSFLEIIKTTPMTVNYNFDDTLEKLLVYNRTGEELVTTRDYETTWRPNAQFQKDHGVIYHPNGYLPSVFEDGASPDLVFADDSFQDQLISAASGQFVHLSNFIFRNTCLLVGLH